MNPDFEAQELIPAIVQDARTGDVRMLGYMNREAYEKTRDTGDLHFYSRSRRALWRKGETSGHTHRVVSMWADCDADALLVQAEPAGPTCHTGATSCFSESAMGTLGRLERVIASRRSERPEGSYTAKLTAEGTHRIAKKVGEEAIETVLAAVDGDRSRLIAESADVLYHLLVLWADRGVALADVLGELDRRMERRS
ncbi:MAG: bifunctional phosphoribosyl-AMP cyclohydrolase/phosphoribosyl-ATP diphosphatase HisIE [Planctomycetes bacterium]|nr:bifunctional phosphoribosyl-AMP cyclohydrolase/phosphoribosyl-ATP diphosphatase HisIE [Planctomycetota bacterium]